MSEQIELIPKCTDEAKRQIPVVLPPLVRTTQTYEQPRDSDDETYAGNYEEAMDSLAPDGYDQGFGSDNCS